MEEKGGENAGQFDARTLKKADFCFNKCTLCKQGREKERGFFNRLVRLEAKLKLCPWCRAYEKVYGVPAYERPPES